MLSRRSLLALVCAVLVVSVLACGLPSIGGSNTQPTATSASTLASNTPAGQAPTATKAAAQAEATSAATATPASSEAAATPTAAAEATVAGQSDEMPEIETSLENVNSYSAVMSVSYRGQDEAEDAAVVMNIVEEVDKANSAERFAIEGTDEDGNPVVMEVITIGQDSWISFGEGWMHTKADEASSMTSMGDEFLSQGDEILSSIDEPRLVERGVTINGIVCDHYAFDKTSVDEATGTGTGTATGEVWISQQDNIMVKMIMNASGDFMGTEGDNIVDMTWELKSLNQPITIAPPEGMGIEDMLPVMEGAEESDNYLVSNDMAMYEIEGTIPDVVAWYDQTLADDGYTKGDADVSDEMGSVTYTKDDVSLSLLVTTSDTEGLVSVILTKQ
ncbi:MAG: hypothetical protein ACYC5O_12660 [Anaerolineae bacterium]